jgi:aspartate aminotransferase
VLKKHPRIIIGTDDMYEHLLLDGSKFVNILNVCPELYGQTVVPERRLEGVFDDRLADRLLRRAGGAHRGDGERAVPQHVESDLDLAVRGRSGAHGRPVLHRADGRGLQGARKVRRRRAEPHSRGSCLPAAGAFYVFPDCRGAIARLHKDGRLKAATDLALCDYLIELPQAVAAVPGSAFGLEGYLRISFATSMDNLRKAIERMQHAMGEARVAA